VFLQPESLQPETIIVDEPELGLHPYAIKILASLIRSASKEKQVIISTQSVTLLNEFEPADIVIADRKDGASVLKRLAPDDLAEWLKEYSLENCGEEHLRGTSITMKRVHVICEGQTEETFVNEVLRPHLASFNVLPIAALVGKPGHEGGHVNTARMTYDIKLRLMHDRHSWCTTFFDFYGLDPEFAEKECRSKASTRRQS